MKHLAKVLVFFLVTIMLMEYFNLPKSGLIALAGTGSLAGAFAAKDLVGNILGGIVIFLDRPFKVGDFIASPNEDISGQVMHIDWRVTEILTDSQVPAYIPNGLFASIIVKNYSHQTTALFEEVIGISYDNFEQAPLIMKDINAYLRSASFVDQSEDIYVNLTNFGDSSLDILVSFIYKIGNYEEHLIHEIKGKALSQIYTIVTKHNAEMPYPTLSLIKQPPQTEPDK